MILVMACNHGCARDNMKDRGFGPETYKLIRDVSNMRGHADCKLFLFDCAAKRAAFDDVLDYAQTHNIEVVRKKPL
jgi:hypothetical protein